MQNVVSSLVWYHGTSKDFDSFKTYSGATFGTGMGEVPLFFSPSESFARLYARGKTGRVFKVKLRWKKVFDGPELVSRDQYWPPQREDLTKEGQVLYDDLASGKIFSGVDPDDWSVFGDSQGLFASILKNQYDVIETTEFKKWLKKNRYDAAYVTGDGEKNVFVFSPKQVTILDYYSTAPVSDKSSSYGRFNPVLKGNLMSHRKLRSQLIRLAHANPDLRTYLLPILAAGKPSMSTGKAKQVVKKLYETQDANPGDSAPKMSRIDLDWEEDDGDFFWEGEIRDQDGTTVEFSMPDHYPESINFRYARVASSDRDVLEAERFFNSLGPWFKDAIETQRSLAYGYREDAKMALAMADRLDSIWSKGPGSYDSNDMRVLREVMSGPEYKRLEKYRYIMFD